MNKQLKAAKVYIMPLSALLLLFSIKPILSSLATYGVALNSVRTGSPVALPSAPPPPVLRPKQDVTQQTMLAELAASEWLETNYVEYTSVACDDHTDPYSTRGWNVCRYFKGDRSSLLRCAFDLETMDITVGTCQKLGG